MIFIDSHAHLQMDRFENDLEDVIKRAIDAGCKYVFVVGYDLDSSERALEIANKYPCIKSIIGVHPHDAEKEKKNNYIKIIEEMLKEENTIAIGEIGLDFYYNWSPREIQEEVFKDQLDLALSLKIPVVLHIRNAFDETFSITRQYDKKLSFLVHSFTGNMEDAKFVTEHNYYYSINGIITFKNNTVKTILPSMKINRLLFETDSPYLAPVPKRGKRNEPSFIPYIIEETSKILNISAEELSQIAVDNTYEFFRLSD